MKKFSRASRFHAVTYLLVIAAYAVLMVLQVRGSVSSTLRGMLVPICAYIVMAMSLNLTVGVLGELSLGHAGFMSVGAFTGTAAAMALQDMIPFAPVRLVLALLAGAVFAAAAGFLIGIPVLRLAKLSRRFSTTSIWAWTAAVCTRAFWKHRTIWPPTAE